MSRYLILVLPVFLTACGMKDVDDRMNLTIYSSEGNLEKVRELIPKVNTLNYISLKGNSPLNSAAYNGHLKVVELLLENGADCTFKDSTGETAFSIAVERGHKNVESFLQAIDGCSTQ